MSILAVGELVDLMPLIASIGLPLKVMRARRRVQSIPVLWGMMFGIGLASKLKSNILFAMLVQ